jgi:uncharacterized damage-inducible protein DinB
MHNTQERSTGSAVMLVTMALLAGPAAPQARSHPLSGEARSDYATVRSFIVRAAEKMADEETAATAPPAPGGEYTQHHAALGKLTIAVAEAMPPGEYDFRPDPPSMSFGEQMSHIAKTNYGYCAGLRDIKAPPMPQAAGKDAIVNALSDSFKYCATVVSNLTDDQLSNPHSSPDGVLPGRDILLAFYVHVAHHRGQAEVYLRDKGIKPPSFIF